MEAKAKAYIALRAADALFGLDLSRVESVIPYGETEPIPFQHSGMIRSILHRGQFMGVVRLADILGVESSFNPDRAVIAVTRAEGGYLGIVAAASSGIVREGEIEETVAVHGRFEGPCVASSVKCGSRTLHIVDFDALVAEVARNLERAG